MGVFNSVYVLKPINKTAANGIASGSLVSIWRTPTKIKHCVVTNVKKKRKENGTARRERRGDIETYFGLRKGKLLSLIDGEKAFLRQSHISRKDEAYQLALAMKLKRMAAVWFCVEEHDHAWRLIYKKKGKIAHPVSELAAELGCTMKTTGGKAEMSRRLITLKSIMEHYEFIGWSVDE